MAIVTFVQIPRVVKYSEKDRLPKQVTILFLAIFFLVKANPYYYQCQYFPTLPGTHSVQTISTNEKSNHQAFLVRVQKSIVEEQPGSFIPAIKFSGIPLLIFAFGLFTLIYGHYIHYSFAARTAGKRLCFAYCTLRL